MGVGGRIDQSAAWEPPSVGDAQDPPKYIQ